MLRSSFRRLGRWSRVIAAVAAVAVGGAAVFSLSSFAHADEKAAAKADGKSVAALAKEGYWGEEANWKTHEPLLGKPAPKLDLKDWIKGPVTAEQMKGKIVIVDFWAVWCGPCLKGVPHNNEVAKKYAEKGVLFVGACGGGGEEAMGDRVTKFKMEYPVAKVSEESVKAWQVGWWPTYAVIDREGNLRAVGIKPDYVEKVVEALLVEQPAK